MNKKFKILLLTSSALIANTAVASTLTSCSFKNAVIDFGGFDNAYGISMATYNRMESDFKDLYQSRENEDLKNGLITKEEYKQNLLNFKSKLNSFHAALFTKKSKAMSYTIKTNALRDFAIENYGIKLSRVLNVNLHEEMNELKISVLGSLLEYMDQYNVNDPNQRDELLEKADNQFEQFKKEAIEKFGYDDIVSIIQYVQSNMYKCFTNICEEFDAIITQQLLSDFLNNYQISVNTNLSENYYWDKLYTKYGSGNQEIEVNDFNKIFTVKTKTSYFYDDSLYANFVTDIIPGYTLRPIIHQMIANSYENNYSIDVDYTLIKNEYLNSDNIAKLTAHSSQLKDDSLYYEDENTTIFDINASDSERQYTNYELPITKEFEEQQINKTYFNGNNFEFTWSDSINYGIDSFWNSYDNSKGVLDKFALADTGMMINGYLLSNLIEEAEIEDISQLPEKKQQAIKLVNNTNFNLECRCIENDESNKVEICDFNTCYTHHHIFAANNTFDAPTSLKNIIDEQVNEDSGVVDRYSVNLYESIKDNYDIIDSKVKEKDEIINEAEEAIKTLNNIETALIILNAVTLTFIVITVVSLYFVQKYCWKETSPSWNYVKKQYASKSMNTKAIAIAIALSLVIIISSTLWYVLDINSDVKDVEGLLEKVGSNGNCNLLVNLRNDQESLKSYENFANLNDVEKKRLKIYYQAGFLEATDDDQLQNDWYEYLGNVNKIEEMKEIISSDIIKSICLITVVGLLTFTWTLFAIFSGVNAVCSYINFVNDYKLTSYENSFFKNLCCGVSELLFINHGRFRIV